MNKKQKVMYGVVCVSMLASCSQSVLQKDQTTATTQDSTQQLSNASSGKTDTISESNGQQKELKISSRCIGCGHCVKFAAQNFKMNFSSHKAEVISQDDIYSDWVDRAIDRCPVDAISIS